MDNLLSVVDNIMENTTQELLASAQIQKSSTSRLLEALDNFIENVAFIYDSMKKKPFNLSDLSIQLPNIGFNINRKVFTSDVFFIARNKDGNASVEITTSASQSVITSETLAVIRVPQQTFLDTPETLFSYQFRKPSLFLTESQLQRLNGKKVVNDQVVDSEVLSASVLGRVIKYLTKNPIILSFKPLQTTNLEETSCQFWNPDLRKSKFVSIILFVCIRAEEQGKRLKTLSKSVLLSTTFKLSVLYFSTSTLISNFVSLKLFQSE